MLRQKRKCKCSLQYVIGPRGPAGLQLRRARPTVPRLSAPLSPPLSSAGGREGEKGDRHPGHDDTAPEEIIDPDTPPRQHYAHAAL